MYLFYNDVPFYKSNYQYKFISLFIPEILRVDFIVNKN